MANYSRSLAQLCECLRDCMPKNPDWMSIIGLANETLTTPALMEFAARFEAQIPEDVCIYIREIYARNLSRNGRLAAQLAEAVAALNDRGVTPVLLKGAAMFATADRSRWGARLMSDLDIMVSPDQTEVALDTLVALGYAEHCITPPDAGKWYIELKRPSDVGMIDLHRELPGPAFFYRALGDVRQYCKIRHVGRGTAYIPSPTYHALILTVHDQFQDSDYWTGKANLPEGINWDALAALSPGKLARNALETQLVALSSLLGVDVPIRMRSRLVPRLQHQRRMAQARVPLLRQALLPAAMLDFRNYRAELGSSNKRGEIIGARKWALPKSSTLRFFFALSRGQRAGKI